MTALQQDLRNNKARPVDLSIVNIGGYTAEDAADRGPKGAFSMLIRDIAKSIANRSHRAPATVWLTHADAGFVDVPGRPGLTDVVADQRLSMFDRPSGLTSDELRCLNDYRATWGTPSQNVTAPK